MGWGYTESCLKWGGGGVIKESFHKHLEIGVSKGKIVPRGRGY